MPDTLNNIWIAIEIAIYFHLTLPILLLVGAALSITWKSLLSGYLKSVVQNIDRFSQGVGHLASWLCLVMVLAMFATVMMRYIFGIGFIWFQESTLYMHGILFMLAAAYTLLVDGHVRVDIFYREIKPLRKSLVDFLGTYFLLLPVMYLTLDVALPYVENSWAVREGSKETSGLQALYVLKTAIIIFAWMMILQGLSQASKAALTLVGIGYQSTAEQADVEV